MVIRRDLDLQNGERKKKAMAKGWLTMRKEVMNYTDSYLKVIRNFCK